MLPQKLESPRLVLEKISMEWLDEIYKGKTGNVLKYCLHFGDLNAVHSWINWCREAADRGQCLTMVVLDKEKREFLGVAAVNDLNIDPQFSLWIKPDAQGRGYGRESVTCLLAWFKETYGQDSKISYLVETDNLASIKLAISVGMKWVGERLNEQGLVFQELVV